MYGIVRNSALRVLGAPSLYVQGRGALAELAPLARRHGGGHLLAIHDAALGAETRAGVEARFADMGARITWAAFGGECTEAEGQRLAQMAAGADVVAGIGGGKCIDIGKFVAMTCDLPAFSVPTIASNDAPTSRLIVLYTDDHAVAGTRWMMRNPDVVLVDTAIIAAAPLRFLRAGIGDALSKFAEARAVVQSGGTTFFGARPPMLTSLMGRACLDTIERTAAPCLAALEQGVTPEDFEDLIEALVLLSGLTFESGGLAVAHSLIRGLTQLPELKGTLHGEQVAYAVQVQLHLEGDEAELHRLRAFARTVGLPTRLSDLGLPASRLRDAAELVSEVTMKAPYMANFPGKTAAADLSRAIHYIETCEDH